MPLTPLPRPRFEIFVHSPRVEGVHLRGGSVARGGLDLGDLADSEEKKSGEDKRKEFRELVEKIKEALGERVKEVRVTQRLTDSPACLVSDENEMSANLARILRAAGQKVPETKPILEINPEHPIVQRLNDETDETPTLGSIM